MRYKYDMSKGLVRTKTKIDAVKASFVSLMIALPALAIVAGSGASALTGGYTLFDSATTVSGGNPGMAVQMVSDGTNPDGGINYDVPSGMTFSQLTNLATDYEITAGDCGGGSPRFQVNVGGKNIFVYIGPAPNFTGCTTNSWVSTGNLTTSADARFDTSQYAGGNVYSTYAQAETLLGDQTVTGIQLVTDAGWAMTGGNQTVLADNTQINTATYTYESTTTPTKDSCKNNGWKSMTTPGPFKNQGDCVSYFATGGRNLPSGKMQ